MRGKVSGAPVQEASALFAVDGGALWSCDVLDETALLYQPIRVLMSVLFRPAAATLIKTSVGPRVGRGRSVLYCSFSGPPWPVRRTPLIASGRVKVFILARLGSLSSC
jgi:hypothetical protein